MSYTIRTLPAPVATTYQDINGPRQRLTRPFVERPASFVEMIYSEGDVELWRDHEGTAKLQQVKTQLPGFIPSLIDLVREAAKEKIEEKWPLWAQNNCALGIYNSDTIDQCKADITMIITASNTAEDAIANAETLEAVIAVIPVWPEI